MTLDDVKTAFADEYGSLAAKFHVYVLGVEEAYEIKEGGVNKPGVYVYWHPKYDVIVIGKSQSNSKKRALDHIRDNTRRGALEMAALKDDKDVRIMLFNVFAKKDLHWVLSLEAFMEWNLSPAIPAGRIG